MVPGHIGFKIALLAHLVTTGEGLQVVNPRGSGHTWSGWPEGEGEGFSSSSEASCRRWRIPRNPSMAASRLKNPLPSRSNDRRNSLPWGPDSRGVGVVLVTLAAVNH